mmetsp:Transcript_17670/g.49404  ORF Transcript_17670/g.49404 Transcript_17670/m.49404 type:complete len:214 (+) Transcript_17670:1417-2058(+)
MGFVALPLANVCAAGDAAVWALEELHHLSPGDDLGPLAIAFLLNILEALHEGVGDGEPREALLSAVSARLSVASQLADEAEVKTEALDKPVHGRAAVVGEDMGEGWGVGWGIGAAEATGALHGVRLKDLRAVLDAQSHLGLGEGAIDAGGGLGGVAAEEGHLVDERDPAAGLQDGVRGAHTGQPSANHEDALFRHSARLFPVLPGVSGSLLSR